MTVKAGEAECLLQGQRTLQTVCMSRMSEAALEEAEEASSWSGFGNFETPQGCTTGREVEAGTAGCGSSRW